MSNPLEDLRSGSADFEETLRAIIGSVLSTRIDHLPVKVSQDSKDGNTVKVKAAVKIRKQNEDGTQEWVELPEFDDAIIRYQGGGGVTTTHPVKAEDEGWITLGSRGVSNWHEKGGVQPEVTHRGNLSDAMFHPGSRSKPNALKGVSKDSSQTRTDNKGTVSDVGERGVTNLRKDAVHQINDEAVIAQKGQTKHFLDSGKIQQATSMFLHNCG